MSPRIDDDAESADDGRDETREELLDRNTRLEPLRSQSRSARTYASKVRQAGASAQEALTP